ncbi:MAG: hypothetical protein AAFX06_30910 [Planctomycetota bacterium]
MGVRSVGFKPVASIEQLERLNVYGVPRAEVFRLAIANPRGPPAV